MGLRLTGTYILQFLLLFLTQCRFKFLALSFCIFEILSTFQFKNHFQFTALMAGSAKIKVTDPCAMAFPPLKF